MEHYEDAIEYFKTSLIKIKQDNEVYYNIALCYSMLDNKELAEKNVLKALDMDKNYKDAKVLLKELKG